MANCKIISAICIVIIQIICSFFCVVTPAPIDYFALFEYDYYDHKQKIAKEKYYYETFRGQ